MRTLSIEVTSGGEAIEAVIRLDGQKKLLQESTRFNFEWSAQDQEDLRWYLEDYLTYPVDPAPSIAARIEKRLQQAGVAFFSALFNSPQTKKIWSVASERYSDLRFEIRTSRPELAVLPWELLRDPESRSVPALSCRSFVRVHAQPSRAPNPPAAPSQSIRMLLAICRPAGAVDVPFRSVASRILQGLEGGAQSAFHVEVLRPPTYGQLSAQLRRAALAGEPYQIVHFDGHGLAGGLIFENPANPENREIIPGEEIGRLLADSGVPILVLNACRSAFSDPKEQPSQAENIHENIRVFGSVAHAAADQGVASVLAMKFNVYVQTAARFMLNFYEALLSGAAVGDAANVARAQLNAEPWRDAVPNPVRLEDWMVPLVFDTGLGQVFKPAPKRRPGSAADALQGRRQIDLPRRPDAGFFGRDETLLALDRAFDSDNVEVLVAFAGSGKTTTACEFARWYLSTGGVRDFALFTSFATKRTLGQVLEQLGRVLEPQFAGQGIQWAAILDAGQRRQCVLDMLRQLSLLWIWDNVEPIAGFPSGAESDWTVEEQAELADFLRDASGLGVKFLLTSRRDEAGWLGMLPSRVDMPAMPFWECLQLTSALARKMGRKASDVADWRPLLEFTRGNPLSVTVLVTQALRARMNSKQEIAGFVAELQSGAAKLVDEPSQGRSRSLTASLSYGLANAFTPAARKAISLLHLFQGLVNSKIFDSLGGGLIFVPEVKAMTAAEKQQMFATACELGLLGVLSSTVYRIHPVLPWFFKNDFETYFAGREQECRYAFCRAMATAAASLSQQFNHSSAGAATALPMEESNLRYALKLSLQLQDWVSVMALLHGLEDLYVSIQGNGAEWSKLVAETNAVVSDEADKSIPGRELAWRAVIEYRMRLADGAHDYLEAYRLARIIVEFYRAEAIPFLADETKLTEGYEEIHNLSVMLESAGTYLARLGSADCIVLLDEAKALAIRIGDNREAALCEQGIGWAYREVDALFDLDKALAHFTAGLKLAPQDDSALLGKLILMRGSIFARKFDLGVNEQTAAWKQNGQSAVECFASALELLPDYAAADRAEANLNLGVTFMRAGISPQAEPYLKEALELARQAGAARSEVTALLNLASVYLQQDLIANALEFAKAGRLAASALGAEGQTLEVSALDLLARIKAKQRAAGQA